MDVSEMPPRDPRGRAVLYLASDEASYVTAAEIVVDGGFAQPACESYNDKIPMAEAV